MSRAWLAVHGHFYQPSREDPFTGHLHRDASAAPFPNWNARIVEEAYRPNADRGNIGRISWDLGPTLATWLRREEPGLHAAYVAQDDGHNAIAQAYHHAILPLASARDRRTEIRWGLRDFELRFGRRATGIWLPETAVDRLTLQICAEEGVRWTILAPWQAEWPVTSGVPGRVLVGGASVGVAFYDADTSGKVSFDPAATRDADDFVRYVLRPRLDAIAATRPTGAIPLGVTSSRGEHAISPKRPAGVPDGGERVLLIVTDGELYGHHQKFRDLFLDRLLSAHDSVALTTPGALLDSVSINELPVVPIHDQTSWSCHHGVTRWSGECPCASDGRWKRPLRQALDRLAAAADVVASDRLAAVGLNAWALRDRYVEVVSEFVDADEWAARELRQAGHPSRERAREQVLAAMRAEESRLGMFTSDGWFWDDPRRQETAQILRKAAHAARTLDGAIGGRLEQQLVDDLHAVRAPRDRVDGTRFYADALRAVDQPAPRWLESSTAGPPG